MILNVQNGACCIFKRFLIPYVLLRKLALVTQPSKISSMIAKYQVQTFQCNDVSYWTQSVSLIVFNSVAASNVTNSCSVSFLLSIAEPFRSYFCGCLRKAFIPSWDTLDFPFVQPRSLFNHNQNFGYETWKTWIHLRTFHFRLYSCNYPIIW